MQCYIASSFVSQPTNHKSLIKLMPNIRVTGKSYAYWLVCVHWSVTRYVRIYDYSTLSNLNHPRPELNQICISIHH